MITCLCPLLFVSVTGGVKLSLGECVLFIFVDFAFVCACMVCRFTSWVGCKSGILSWGLLLKALFVVVLLMFDVSNV